MERFLYSLLLPLSILCSCIYEDEADCCRPTKVRVEIAVRPDLMMTVTRADEATIRDLNFYLYDDNGNVVLHRYQTSATLRFECLPGSYRIRIAANMGRDLGENPASEDFTVSHADEYDVLPMSYESDVTINSSSGGVLALPAVEVRRCVAKVSYTIAVEPADIELRSVQLLSVPRSVSVFDMAAAPSDNPDDYTDCPETELLGQQAAGDCYLLPNMQGVVATITDQKQKNPENAPANASYLLIRAVRGEKVLAYYVYLGGNNTSDFNIRANVHYRFNISILGDSEVNTRISSYTLRVRDDFDDYNYGGYCLLDGTRYLYIDVDSPDGTGPDRGRLEVLSGDLNSFTFNYGDKGAVHDFDLYDSAGENAYEIEYYTPVYTPENSLLSYRITLTDALGFTQNYDFSHRMANAAIIHTDGGGSVRVEDALHVETESEGSEERTVALCMERCMLTAVPDTGYAFAGWYDGPQEYGHLLSIGQTYEYVPLGPLRHIYAVFQSSEIQLDALNTANCYIAPELLRDYSFDATVQGNGCATLNITPQRLSGAYARLIWETGTQANRVISSLNYDGSRIRFRTGTQQGNALIGLFDARGECVWSWHIWVTDYNPESSSQKYSSGDIFMDRNLGAVGTDYTQVTACGLYYQWGRKDPFPHPASFTNNAKPASFIYHDSYAYGTIRPEEQDAREVMSMEWAMQHPTTFIRKADYEVDDSEEDVLDWLFRSHHNLWGNTTEQGNAVSKVCRKTIYDPCPPGWRVPDACDFEGIAMSQTQFPYCVNIVYSGRDVRRRQLLRRRDIRTGLYQYALLLDFRPGCGILRWRILHLDLFGRNMPHDERTALSSQPRTMYQ
uniref:DUF4906 domain-containing protein n=1 Tax=Alistipes ihumii TaxID=1470347 RepID=UPI002494AABE